MTTRALPAPLAVPGARRLLPFVAVAAAAGLGVLAAERPVLALLGTAVLCLCIATIVRPDTATLVVAAILYSNAAAILAQDYDVPYIVAASFPALMLLPLAYLVVVKRERLVVVPALPWLLAFLVAVIISAMLAKDWQPAFEEVRSLVLEGLAIVVLTTNVIRSSETLRQVIWVLVGVGAFLGALSVYQQFSGSFGNNFGGFAEVSTTTEGFTTGVSGFTEEKQPRLGGPFDGGGANRYAQILLVLVPLAMYLMFTARRRALQLVALGGLVLLAFGVVLTFSRGAAIGFALLVPFMVALRYLKLRHVAVLALGVTLIFIAVPSYWLRLSSLEAVPGVASAETSRDLPDTSVQSRSTENLAALLIFADHPAFGVGPGLYPQYYEAYADRVGDYSNAIEINHKRTTRQAHNLYLGLLSEVGVIGLFLFLAVNAVTLRELGRARKLSYAANRPDLARLAAALSLALLAYLLTAILLHLAYQRYFWFIIALGCAAAVVIQREVRPAPESDPERTPRLAGG